MDRPTAAARSAERRIVAILASGQALYLMTAITVMTLAGLIGQRLAPSAGLATLPIAAKVVGTMFATLPASLAMGRYGRRAGFVGGALVGTAGAALALVAIVIESFWAFCLGNLLLGVYQAFAQYYRFAAADVASEDFRARAISLVLAGGVVAGAIAPWMASGSVDLIATVPFAGAYLILVGLCLSAAALLARIDIPAPALRTDLPPPRPMAEILTQPAFMVAVFGAAVGYAVMILIMTATPIAMIAAGHRLADAALVMQGHVLGMFLPSFVTGHLITRFGVLRIMLVGAGLLAACILVALTGDGIAHFWVALVLLGVGWNFLFVGGTTLLASCHGATERAKTQGFNDLLIFTLVAVAALSAGGLLETAGWTAVQIGALPFVLASAAATIWLSLRRTSTVAA